MLHYKPQLTLLTLSRLLHEVSCFTASAETSQALRLSQEKKCNTVFPGLSKWVWKQSILGLSKWRL